MSGPDRPELRHPELRHPELSRKVQISTLGRRNGARGATAAPEEVLVEAGPEELAALARRLGVPAVASLRCRFRLGGADSAGRISADGLLTATLTRVCVSSLEEFPSQVAEAFAVRFVPADAAEDEGEDTLDPDVVDDIPYEGTQIDLGEAAVEQLALAMEPYPRKPGVELPDGVGSTDSAPASGEDGDGDGDGGGDGVGARPNPFAVLLQRKLD